MLVISSQVRSSFLAVLPPAPANPPYSDGTAADALVTAYFADVVLQNELQRRMMRTYALSFKTTCEPEETKPTGKELSAFITEQHSVEDLFSSQILFND